MLDQYEMRIVLESLAFHADSGWSHLGRYDYLGDDPPGDKPAMCTPAPMDGVRLAKRLCQELNISLDDVDSPTLPVAGLEGEA